MTWSSRERTHNQIKGPRQLNLQCGGSWLNRHLHFTQRGMHSAAERRTGTPRERRSAAAAGKTSTPSAPPPPLFRADGHTATPEHTPQTTLLTLCNRGNRDFRSQDRRCQDTSRAGETVYKSKAVSTPLRGGAGETWGKLRQEKNSSSPPPRAAWNPDRPARHLAAEANFGVKLQHTSQPLARLTRSPVSSLEGVKPGRVVKVLAFTRGPLSPAPVGLKPPPPLLLRGAQASERKSCPSRKLSASRSLGEPAP